MHDLLDRIGDLFLIDLIDQMDRPCDIFIVGIVQKPMFIMDREHVLAWIDAVIIKIDRSDIPFGEVFNNALRIVKIIIMHVQIARDFPRFRPIPLFIDA